MANFGSTMANAGFNVTNGMLNNILAVQLNNLEHLLIHGKHKGVRFYYDQTSGGNVLTVMTKSLIGGAVSELSSLAKNTFKDLLWKDDKPTIETSGWAFDRAEAVKAEIKKNFGEFHVKGSNGDGIIYAVDQQGFRCRDALMMGIPVAEAKRFKFEQSYRNEDVIIDFRTVYIKNKTKETQYVKNEIEKCDHLVWFDTSAIVSVDSQKNLVVSQVQGRDYSRKELVSNGDINISVSGVITSLYPDVYPSEEVKKLRQILRYKGVIEVNNVILDGWDIDKIIIKDFSFPQEEGGKATQRYSFNAVAVQPMRLSEVEADTIKIITQPFDTEDKKENKWVNMLEQQLARLKQAAGSLVDVGISQGADLLNKEVINQI